VLDEGLYTPENVDAVYEGVLRRAHLSIGEGRTVVLDGTWGDPRHRGRARQLSQTTAARMLEFVCAAPLDATVARIRTRTETSSQATPEIATALAERDADVWPGAHRLDTTRPPADSLAEAQEICRLNT
jgi:predicted kinase